MILMNCEIISHNLDKNKILNSVCEWNTSPPWVKNADKKQCKHTPDLIIIRIMAQKSPILSIGLGYKNAVFITFLGFWRDRTAADIYFHIRDILFKNHIT